MWPRLLHRCSTVLWRTSWILIGPWFLGLWSHTECEYLLDGCFDVSGWHKISSQPLPSPYTSIREAFSGWSAVNSRRQQFIVRSLLSFPSLLTVNPSASTNSCACKQLKLTLRIDECIHSINLIIINCLSHPPKKPQKNIHKLIHKCNSTCSAFYFVM